MNKITRIVLGLALALGAAPAFAQDFGSPELIAAANKEGRLVYYTANFAEVEQEFLCIDLRIGRASCRERVCLLV